MDYNPLLISVLVFVTSCQAQLLPPTNVTAVYVADGFIRVTWSPPDTTENIEQYVAQVQETGEYGYTGSPDNRVYLYNNTKPDTTYTFKVSTIIYSLRGSSQTTVTTPAFIFRQRGRSARLVLPKPPPGISHIELSGRTLFTFVGGVLDGSSATEDGITVRLTTTNAELAFVDLTTEHAGYYYTMRSSGNVILGGELLVVTDIPTRPTITPSSPSPVLEKSVTLGCISTSQSNPANHGLVLTSSWKVNESDVNNDRFFISGSNLIIDPVRLRDKYNVYTCVTHEDGQGSSRLSSEESSGFLLTPRYGPQFVTTEDAEGRSPLIRGDVYGPVICRTDCNPGCVLEWRRQGKPFIAPEVRPSNQLELVDQQLPRTREITYTCRARASGFTASPLEKNITVEVYFSLPSVPSSVTAMSYLDEVDEHRPIGREDIRYTEGFTFVLSVDVDSNPSSDVTLSRDQTTITVGVPTTAGKHDVQLSGSLQCHHTGSYQVRAANFVTRNRSNVDPAVRTFGLQVSCSPRRQGIMNNVIGVGGKKGQTIALSVTVIANPKPTIRWFTGVMSLPVIKNNAYMYTIRGEVRVTEQSDFREYHVNVTNGIGGELMVKFEISPEDVPDIPIDFRASEELGSNEVKVMWTSGFNGGNPQQFHIDFRTVGNEWLPGTSNISDAGQGALMAYTLKGLTPATDYVIRLKVSNKFGMGKSSEIRVRTLGVPDKPIEFRASEVGHIIINVVWRSGFNGGISQLFHIDFMTIGNEWLPGTSNISDAGQGALMAYILPDLTHGTDYVIRLNVSNKVGPGNSSEIRVRTLEIPLTASSQSSLTLAILISFIVILAVALIIAILVIKRIRSQQGQEQIHVNQELQGSTTDRHLQSGANLHELQGSTTDRHLQSGARLHELQERTVQEQEHMYDIVNDDRRGLEVGANEGDSQYTGLEPSRGQEHMYGKPQHDSTATRGRQGRAVKGGR